MKLFTNPILFVDNFFNETVPKAQVRFLTMKTRRLISIRAKKADKDKDFNKKYKSIVLPYWKKYGIKPNKKAYKILWRKGVEPDPRYIPDDLWYSRVIRHFSDIKGYRNLGDKALQSLFVSDIKCPETVFKSVHSVWCDHKFSPLSEKDICCRCKAAQRIIIKPSCITSGGEGIEFLDVSGMSNDEILRYFKAIKYDFIVQKIVKQHKILSDINSSSVNTIRVLTLCFKEEVYILSAVLRMGSNGSQVDNVTQGGFACRIHEDGRLDKYAVSRKSDWNTVHPGGVVFEDVVIPNYKEIIENVKKAAKKIPYFKILGWDLAVDESGAPVFIEFNVMAEQNQKTCGPAFGDMTDEILAEVFLKK